MLALGEQEHHAQQGLRVLGVEVEVLADVAELGEHLRVAGHDELGLLGRGGAAEALQRCAVDAEDAERSGCVHEGLGGGALGDSLRALHT